MTHPKYVAKNCRGSESKVVDGIKMKYFKAFTFELSVYDNVGTNYIEFYFFF